MTELEKQIIKCLADVAKTTTDIGIAQAKMSVFIAERFPDINADEKQTLLEAGAATQRQMKLLQELAANLSSIV